MISNLQKNINILDWLTENWSFIHIQITSTQKLVKIWVLQKKDELCVIALFAQYHIHVKIGYLKYLLLSTLQNKC